MLFPGEKPLGFSVSGMTASRSADANIHRRPRAGVQTSKEIGSRLTKTVAYPSSILPSDPLGAALRDNETPVRIAAAEALGEVGDERSISPLVEALRDCFPARSARRSRIGGILFVITVPLALIAFVGMAIVTRGELVPSGSGTRFLS
jgi:hypothetical protein